MEWPAQQEGAEEGGCSCSQPGLTDMGAVLAQPSEQKLTWNLAPPGHWEGWKSLAHFLFLSAKWGNNSLSHKKMPCLLPECPGSPSEPSPSVHCPQTLTKTTDKTFTTLEQQSLWSSCHLPFVHKPTCCTQFSLNSEIFRSQTHNFARASKHTL